MENTVKKIDNFVKRLDKYKDKALKAKELLVEDEPKKEDKKYFIDFFNNVFINYLLPCVFFFFVFRL
jgi:hypothetical protein